MQSLRLLAGFLFLSVSLLSTAQNLTKIKGHVTDKNTGEALPFVNVFFEGKNIGTNTDYDGNYEIVTRWASKKLSASFVGYKKLTKEVIIGKNQQINFELEAENVSLNEVVINSKKKRYRNKNNPAVALIKKVIDHKEQNRLSDFNYYQYKKYEKVELDINNFTEKFKKRRALKKFQFVFDYIDTSEINGKPYLPVFLKESLSDIYFRKSPKARKEYVQATKIINFHEYLDDAGLDHFLNYMYQDIDIYQNNINILTNDFISPLSPLAPITYKFRIIDTVQIEGTDCIELAFQPRNNLDFAFVGKLYITHDDRYAVIKLIMKVNEHINLNFVNDLVIKQEFAFIDNKAWVLKKDAITIDFNIGNRTIGIFGKKQVNYKNFIFNKAQNDSIYKGVNRIVYVPDYLNKDKTYWQNNRLVPLSKSEKNIYLMTDSLKSIPVFKTGMDILVLLMDGYWNFGKIDLGPVSTFYSFNEVEGSKIRIGGQTSDKYSELTSFAGHVTYGTLDKQYKYAASIIQSLNGKSVRKFPQNTLSFTYEKETKFPGMALFNTNENNLFLSFKRGVADKLIYYELFNIQHYADWGRGFSTKLNLRHEIQQAGGSLKFDYADYSLDKINISELVFKIRFAPNEKFYQRMNYRSNVTTKYPILSLEFTKGFKDVFNSDFKYDKLAFSFFKRIYLSPLGFTNFYLETGKVFGSAVPYPLLFIHRANQTYSYQNLSFNMMNFLEFVSDQYVAIYAEHHFYGFFFNKIPLFKHLKWREIITFKGIYGNVTDQNNPNVTQGLMLFPSDSNGNPTTFSLQEKPYIEIGAGIGNIFKFFRIDYVQRLTYLNNPNVQSWGIRMKIKFDF